MNRFNEGKILVACEESQTITSTLRREGFEAYSCDLLPTSGEHPEWHIQGDAIEEAYSGKYLAMIAHPPCTYLSVSGAKWYYHPDDRHLPFEQRRPHPRFPNRRADQKKAIEFFMELYNAPIEYVAVENPVGIMSTVFRKPDQIIQPYQFGEPHSKATCLWLTGFDKLTPTNVVEAEFTTFESGKRMPKWYVDAARLSKEERSRVRSKTFQGIADAMVQQWFVEERIKQ